MNQIKSSRALMIQRREIARGCDCSVMISVAADIVFCVRSPSVSEGHSRTMPSLTVGLLIPLTFPQISSGHLRRLFNPQQPQHGRCDVCQRSAFAQLYADGIFVD